MLLLEQIGLVGGWCSTFEREGFRFDLGASILEVISSIEEPFRRLGTTLQR